MPSAQKLLDTSSPLTTFLHQKWNETHKGFDATDGCKAREAITSTEVNGRSLV